MKIILLVPIQKGEFSIMYNIFNDLCLALDEANVSWERIFVTMPTLEKFNYSKDAKMVEGNNLKNYIKLNTDEETTLAFTIVSTYP